jgi:hypothetical protein
MMIRASMISSNSVLSFPAKAQSRGRARNSERGQTKVPSPTRLSSMPTSSMALRASRSDVRAMPSC